MISVVIPCVASNSIFVPARTVNSFVWFFLFDFLPVLSLDYLIKELLPTPVA